MIINLLFIEPGIGKPLIVSRLHDSRLETISVSTLGKIITLDILGVFANIGSKNK